MLAGSRSVYIYTDTSIGKEDRKLMRVFSRPFDNVLQDWETHEERDGIVFVFVENCGYMDSIEKMGYKVILVNWGKEIACSWPLWDLNTSVSDEWEQGIVKINGIGINVEYFCLFGFNEVFPLSDMIDDKPCDNEKLRNSSFIIKGELAQVPLYSCQGVPCFLHKLNENVFGLRFFSDGKDKSYGNPGDLELYKGISSSSVQGFMQPLRNLHRMNEQRHESKKKLLMFHDEWLKKINTIKEDPQEHDPIELFYKDLYFNPMEYKTRFTILECFKSKDLSSILALVISSDLFKKYSSSVDDLMEPELSMFKEWKSLPQNSRETLKFKEIQMHLLVLCKCEQNNSSLIRALCQPLSIHFAIYDKGWFCSHLDLLHNFVVDQVKEALGFSTLLFLSPSKPRQWAFRGNKTAPLKPRLNSLARNLFRTNTLQKRSNTLERNLFRTNTLDIQIPLRPREIVSTPEKKTTGSSILVQETPLKKARTLTMSTPPIKDVAVVVKETPMEETKRKSPRKPQNVCKRLF